MGEIRAPAKTTVVLFEKTRAVDRHPHSFSRAGSRKNHGRDQDQDPARDTEEEPQFELLRHSVISILSVA
jgi:hypothetical protein